MKMLIKLISLIIMMFTSSTVMATAMCATSDVKLDYVQLAYNTTAPAPIFDVENDIPTPTATAISATDCILLLGNDKPKPSGHNIGEYQDGLLNGEVDHSNSPASLKPYNTLFDPFYDPNNPTIPLDQDGGVYNPNLLFIDPAEDLQDLDDTDGNDNKTDPGWIYLGKDDGYGFGLDENSEAVEVKVGKDLTGEVTVTDDLVDIDFICAVGTSLLDDNCTAGRWSIMPAYNIADTLETLLGEGFFDQLAIVIKTGNICHPTDDPLLDAEGRKGCIDEFEGPQFVIYDFNFEDIFDDFTGGNGAAALEFPYNLGGTFDLGSTFHGSAISHFSVLVRDPSADENVISEPRINLLLLFGVMLILLRVKSTSTAL